MKFKHMIGVIGALAISSALSYTAFAAQYTAEAVVSEDKSKVTIDIGVAPDAEETDLTIAGYAFTLKYDPSILQVSETGEKDILGDSLYAVSNLNEAKNVMVTDNNSGELTVAYAQSSETKIDSKKSIVSVTFDVLSKSNTEIGVDFFSVANNGETLASSVSKGITEATGFVKLTSDIYVKGDATGDGIVDANDAAHVFELSTKEAYEYSEKIDMDNDKKITENDAIIILQGVLKEEF